MSLVEAGLDVMVKKVVEEGLVVGECKEMEGDGYIVCVGSGLGEGYKVERK